MTALTFSLKSPPRQRVDVGALTPDQLAGKSPAEICGLPLQIGNRKSTVDELFNIEGDDTANIVFRGLTGKLDYVGKTMRTGAIRVEGDAGSYLGFQMQGGRLEVTGNADAYAACEMKDGMLLIRGNAGDFLGASLPGNKKGMAGGVVIVKGNTGDRVGDHMRRGAILIEGSAGDYLGSRMSAGTIAVSGRVGAHIGYAMNRGTLLLLQAPESVPPTFNDCGCHSLGFLPLLLKSFSKLDTSFGMLGDSVNRVRRYAGDMAGLGKGEILIAL
jgi:formylmethanofuran dehydrogenase subunit C